MFHFDELQENVVFTTSPKFLIDVCHPNPIMTTLEFLHFRRGALYVNAICYSVGSM